MKAAFKIWKLQKCKTNRFIELCFKLLFSEKSEHDVVSRTPKWSVNCCRLSGDKHSVHIRQVTTRKSYQGHGCTVLDVSLGSRREIFRILGFLPKQLAQTSGLTCWAQRCIACSHNFFFFFYLCSPVTAATLTLLKPLPLGEHSVPIHVTDLQGNGKEQTVKVRICKCKNGACLPIENSVTLGPLGILAMLLPLALLLLLCESPPPIPATPLT